MLICAQKRNIMRKEVAEIGEQLRRRREMLGLLQPQLAAIAKVSTRTIQLIEAGKANPTIDSILKIADSLGLTLKLTLRDTAAGTVTITEPLM
jgi:y4mF family transcriptional regulator